MLVNFFSTAVRAVIVAKLEILDILFLTSFTLAIVVVVSSSSC